MCQTYWVRTWPKYSVERYSKRYIVKSMSIHANTNTIYQQRWKSWSLRQLVQPLFSWFSYEFVEFVIDLGHDFDNTIDLSSLIVNLGSTTDSTEQLVWFLCTCGLCYMLFLLYFISYASVYTHHTTTNWWWDLEAVRHTVRGVGGSGIRILTLDTETSLYAEDRGLQVPMVLEHDIPHTSKCVFRSLKFCDSPDDSPNQALNRIKI
jgi:hypothetical protein